MKDDLWDIVHDDLPELKGERRQPRTGPLHPLG
jgi:hypothetical protein